jgi:hypothetical protein
MTTTLFANPYDISANGFYFTNIEEYNTKSAALRNDCGGPVEEFEIDYIDGENSDLFQAFGVNQANLEQWFDIEDRDFTDEEKAAFFYLVSDLGKKPEEALELIDDVRLFEGKPQDYVEEILDEIHPDIPSSLRNYIDTEAMARDMGLNGEIAEIDHNGTHYVVTNPLDF